MHEAARLSVELERAALHAVKRTYDDLNGSFFRWKLEVPSFLFVDAGEKLGFWSQRTRILALSRALLFEHGWGSLVEVLKHEMAHQYVEEVLGVVGESSHGPTFRRVCEERGFDAKATGIPAPRESSPILDRIAKLLALAESSNEHEAQAAMSAAQRLMLKHNIDAVSASTRSVYTYRHLGEPTGRVLESQRLLAAILNQHFFVEVIWVSVWRALEGKRGSVMEVCGTPENVELAEYVHAFLTHTAERLWREHKRADRVRGDGGRQSYLAGVMSGFREKLERERKKNASQGLVWVGDSERERYFRSRHPNVRWGRYRSGAGSAAYASGREAGRNIVLHRGISSSPGGTVRMLAPRSNG
jgi:hypothetical protein